MILRNEYLFLHPIFDKHQKQNKMKKGIHPKEYRLVVFKDITNGISFISKSTANSKEKIEVDGVEYPLIKLEISNTSHNFYTGQTKLIDATGRVDKFKKRYSSFGTKK